MPVIAPRVVGSPTFAESNGAVQTTLTIAKPTVGVTVQNGDLLIAQFRCGSSSQTTDYTLAGWRRRGYAFPPSSASGRVTTPLQHYVTDATSEPSSYVFALAGNAFARQSAMMFVVRVGVGAVPWGAEPSDIGDAPNFDGTGPLIIPLTGTITVPANCLAIYSGGNEITSPNATSWVAPSGTTDLGVHGSQTSQADTSVTRSVVATAVEAVSGTTIGGSGKSFTFPVYSSPGANLFAIPGTNQAAAGVLPGFSSVGDLEYSYLYQDAGLTAPTKSLQDLREAKYTPNDFAYFSGLSGLAPAQNYSLADHKLAYYRTLAGISTGSLADAMWEALN